MLRCEELQLMMLAAVMHLRVVMAVWTPPGLHQLLLLLLLLLLLQVLLLILVVVVGPLLLLLLLLLLQVLLLILVVVVVMVVVVGPLLLLVFPLNLQLKMMQLVPGLKCVPQDLGAFAIVVGGAAWSLVLLMEGQPSWRALFL